MSASTPKDNFSMRSQSDYLERLARFVSETPLSSIPPEVLQRTKEILVDSLPVLALGMHSPEMANLSQKQMASAAPGNAWVIGHARACRVAASLVTILAVTRQGIAGNKHGSHTDPTTDITNAP